MSSRRSVAAGASFDAISVVAAASLSASSSALRTVSERQDESRPGAAAERLLGEEKPVLFVRRVADQIGVALEHPERVAGDPDVVRPEERGGDALREMRAEAQKVVIPEDLRELTAAPPGVGDVLGELLEPARRLLGRAAILRDDVLNLRSS